MESGLFKIFMPLVLFVNIFSSVTASSQDATDYRNSTFLKKLNNDNSYLELKKEIIHEFADTSPGHWGEFVSGVNEILLSKDKIIAFTFDACGGKNGNGYDEKLVEYLRKEKIPATLFVSGKWIDSRFTQFLNLSNDTLFEIENHGLNHKPCSINGENEYGIKGTANIGEAFDEIEANASKIEAITGTRPRYYRSATAFTDEACAKLASRLGITMVSYQVLSGDAVPFSSESEIENKVLKSIKPGSIVIMHFNHPEWNTEEALEKIVPQLRKMGYSFVLLKNYKLASFHRRD